MNDQETAALVDIIIRAIRSGGSPVLPILSTTCAWSCGSAKTGGAGSTAPDRRGAPEAMRRHPAVIEAYLGADDEKW